MITIKATTHDNISAEKKVASTYAGRLYLQIQDRSLIITLNKPVITGNNIYIYFLLHTL